MLGFLRSLIITAIIAVCFSTVPASASKLVFLEIYMAPGCKDNYKFIDDLSNVLKDDQDVIVMNCNLQVSDEKTGINPYEKACEDRRFHYTEVFGYFSGSMTTKAVVNGKLEASMNNVETAIKASRSLHDIERLELEREGQVLHILISDFKAPSKTGELYLNVYAPSENNTSLVVDPDIALTEELQNKLKNNMSVPFVTETQLKPPKLREVVAQQRIGTWQKGTLNISIPLERFALFGYNLEEMGYIVSLHEGENYGPVMAAGEIKPITETMISMPHETLIEQKSYPPQNRPPEEIIKEIEDLTGEKYVPPETN